MKKRKGQGITVLWFGLIAILAVAISSQLLSPFFDVVSPLYNYDIGLILNLVIPALFFGVVWSVISA